MAASFTYLYLYKTLKKLETKSVVLFHTILHCDCVELSVAMVTEHNTFVCSIGPINDFAQSLITASAFVGVRSKRVQ
jgi:hypothetical protein